MMPASAAREEICSSRSMSGSAHGPGVSPLPQQAPWMPPRNTSSPRDTAGRPGPRQRRVDRHHARRAARKPAPWRIATTRAPSECADQHWLGQCPPELDQARQDIARRSPMLDASRKLAISLLIARGRACPVRVHPRPQLPVGSTAKANAPAGVVMPGTTTEPAARPGPGAGPCMQPQVAGGEEHRRRDRSPLASLPSRGIRVCSHQEGAPLLQVRVLLAASPPGPAVRTRIPRLARWRRCPRRAPPSTRTGQRLAPNFPGPR